MVLNAVDDVASLVIALLSMQYKGYKITTMSELLTLPDIGSHLCQLWQAHRLGCFCCQSWLKANLLLTTGICFQNHNVIDLVFPAAFVSGNGHHYLMEPEKSKRQKSKCSYLR